MNYVSIDCTQPPISIPLGKCGEHLATQIIFDCSYFVRTYGNGTAQLIHAKQQRFYPVAIEQDKEKVKWTVTNADTATVGAGQAELRWYVGETLAKSVIFHTGVTRTLMGKPETNPPAPEKSWVDQVLKAANEIKNSALTDEKLQAAIGTYLTNHPMDRLTEQDARRIAEEVLECYIPPVHSVNDKVGAVKLCAADVGAWTAEQTEAALAEKADTIRLSASGETIHITNSANDPFLFFGLYGKTKQTGVPTLEHPIMPEYSAAQESITVTITDGTVSQIQEVTIPNGLHGIAVADGGNYTDSTGQQWICDSVEGVCGAWELVRRCGVFTIREDTILKIGKDDDSNTVLVDIKTENFHSANYPTNCKDHGNRAYILCNVAVPNHDIFNIDQLGVGYTYKSNFLRIRLPREAGNTVSEVKAYIAALRTPITIVYVLAQPYHAQITGEAAAQLDALHSRYRTTDIRTGDSVGLHVLCAADMRLYVDEQCGKKEGVYELIETVTAATAVSVDKQAEPDGTSYQFDAVHLKITLAKRSETQTIGDVSFFAGGLIAKASIDSILAENEAYAFVRVFRHGGFWDGNFSASPSTSEMFYDTVCAVGSAYTLTNPAGNNCIDRFTVSNLPEGAVLEIFAIRHK